MCFYGHFIPARWIRRTTAVVFTGHFLDHVANHYWNIFHQKQGHLTRCFWLGETAFVARSYFYFLVSFFFLQSSVVTLEEDRSFCLKTQ